MDSLHHSLVVNLSRARLLVMYSATRYKILGGTMTFVAYCNAWYAVDGGEVVAKADTFPSLWEVVRGRMFAAAS